MTQAMPRWLHAGVRMRAPNHARELPDSLHRTEPYRHLGTGEVAIVPMHRRGSRGQVPVGVYLVSTDRLRYVPAVDVGRIGSLVAATCVSACAAAAVAAIARRPAVGPVTMGPGGWVSVRGARGGSPSLRPGGRGRRRPWWAGLLRVRRLVVEP